MYQPRFDKTATVDLIEAQIVDGLGQCKSIADIAKEIAAHLQDPLQPARRRLRSD